MNDLFNIRGKTALITGGSRGIGLMIAQGMVEAGAKVYIVSRKADAVAHAANKLAESGECIGLSADLSREAGIQALANSFREREEKLHILINNAGTTWGAPLAEYPDKAWDKVLGLNVKAPFTLTRELLPQLKAAGTLEDPARVINTGSIAGMRTDIMQAYAYSASKAALHHVTHLLANELAPKHITVNAIAPGPFHTKMTSFMLDNPSMEKAMAKQIPLGRIGTPEDVAGMAIFLSSRAGAFVTGTVIPLDGGLSNKP
ncbi:MAG: glucose 1-dehydrogenase [Pseudomonadota bacterium]|nr:glucose 1-dehydrogenase [Pseudomonadota bacterium]